MIYTTGTVSTVSGSAIVKGTGTKFKNNNPAINIGMTILIKSGTTNIPYMIKSVNSDTELVLAQPALATATNTTFSIHITEPDNNSDAARTMVAINSYVEYFLDAMNTWMTQTGQTKIEMPNGEIITLDSIKKMQSDISKKLSPGDFGLGSSALNSDKTNAPTNEDANNIQRSGFYAGNGSGSKNFLDNYMPLISATRSGGADGTGTVFQMQATTDFNSADIGFRRRSNNIWNDWQLLATKTTANTQRFNGQLSSHNGVFSTDKDNPNSYFGLLKASRGSEYKIFLSYEGNGYSIKFPERRGGTFMLVESSGVKSSKDDFDNNGFYTATNINSNSPTSVFTGFISAHAHQPNAYQTGIFGRNGNLFYTYKENGNWVATYEILHLGNAKPDSNGFYKKASPIIDINPNGTFITNDESEGATVTRVAKGEYLIEGVLGFNADAGWGGVDGGIEIPLDVNKQPLVWVNSKVNKDGSILVKTYHRTHSNAPEFANNKIDGYRDGDPIDIPDGRFISVRVQMPEQSIYNVRMREMEEAQKVEEERRKKEEEMKEQYGDTFSGENRFL